MKRGEIGRVRLPFSSGHTQSGERPALIIQDDSLFPALPTVLVVPFTGTQAATRFGGTILVQPDGINGLTVASVALVFQTCAIDKRDCVRQLGTLDQSTVDQILTVLDQLTGR